jgi:UDP-N-acetylglucosamine 2-epimerase (non-hydrolysing)
LKIKTLCVFGARPEAVRAGAVKLVGTDAQVITDEMNNLFADNTIYSAMSFAHNPYGDGKSCQRILDKIIDYKGL